MCIDNDTDTHNTSADVAGDNIAPQPEYDPELHEIVCYDKNIHMLKYKQPVEL